MTTAMWWLPARCSLKSSHAVPVFVFRRQHQSEITDIDLVWAVSSGPKISTHYQVDLMPPKLCAFSDVFEFWCHSLPVFVCMRVLWPPKYLPKTNSVHETSLNITWDDTQEINFYKLALEEVTYQETKKLWIFLRTHNYFCPLPSR